MNNKTHTNTYLLRTLSNLHVGSGDNNYGIIDKEVQRDVTDDKFPTIHSSGLKGAYREFFENNPNIKSTEVIDVFGSPKGDSGNKADTKSGKYHFFNALCLSLPIRSNIHPFYNGTSPEILKMFVEKLELFNSPQMQKVKEAFASLSELKPEQEKPIYFDGTERLILEDFRAVQTELVDDDHYKFAQKLIGNRIALFNHADLRILANELPIIARNSLENGESVNLWYEEVVPRETRFYFFVKHNDEGGFFEENRDNVIQLGGNASIGYGYSLVNELGKL